MPTFKDIPDIVPSDYMVGEYGFGPYAPIVINLAFESSIAMEMGIADNLFEAREARILQTKAFYQRQAEEGIVVEDSTQLYRHKGQELWDGQLHQLMLVEQVIRDETLQGNSLKATAFIQGKLLEYGIKTLAPILGKNINVATDAYVDYIKQHIDDILLQGKEKLATHIEQEMISDLFQQETYRILSSPALDHNDMHTMLSGMFNAFQEHLDRMNLSQENYDRLIAGANAYIAEEKKQLDFQNPPYTTHRKSLPLKEVQRENQRFFKTYGLQKTDLSETQQRALHRTVQRMNYHQHQLQQQQLLAVERERVLANYQGLNDLFGTVSQLGGDFANVGIAGQQTVAIHKSLALLSGNIPGVIIPSGFALLSPVSTIFSGAMTIIGLFRKRQPSANPNQDMIKQLQNISQQINDLNKSMKEHFHELYRGQEIIYQSIIESTKFLERRMSLELRRLNDALFPQLDTITNRLAILEQEIHFGFNAIELQPLMGFKDTIDHMSGELEDFQGENLREWKGIHKNLLAWARQHCKSPNLTGRGRLQADKLKNPSDSEFSADVYKVINELFSKDISYQSVQVGYLAEFARQVIGIPIDTNSIVHFDSWLLSLQLLTQLQGAFLKHNVTNFDPRGHQLDSVISQSKNFRTVIKQLQEQSDQLFKILTTRYNRSYNLFLGQLKNVSQKKSMEELTMDPGLYPSLSKNYNLFSETENIIDKMTLEELFALKRSEIDVFLEPSMMKPNQATLTALNVKEVKADAAFKQALNIDKILTDFSKSVDANNISKTFFLGYLIGHGQMVLKIDEIIRYKTTICSRTPGSIEASLASATYAISLCYKDKNKSYEVMKATYAMGNPGVDRGRVGTHDTSGNGASKMRAAIAQYQAQYDASENDISSISFFNKLWPTVGEVSVHLDKKAPIINNTDLLLPIAKLKMELLKSIRLDTTIQRYLTRLDADYQLLAAFAQLIGFNDKIFSIAGNNQDIFTTLGTTTRDKAVFLQVSSLANSHLFEQYLHQYELAIANSLAQQPLNTLDPIMALLQIDMPKVLSSLNIVLSQNAHSDQLVSPLLLMIEEQLMELELAQAKQLAFQAGLINIEKYIIEKQPASHVIDNSLTDCDGENCSPKRYLHGEVTREYRSGLFLCAQAVKIHEFPIMALMASMVSQKIPLGHETVSNLLAHYSLAKKEINTEVSWYQDAHYEIDSRTGYPVFILHALREGVRIGYIKLWGQPAFCVSRGGLHNIVELGGVLKGQEDKIDIEQAQERCISLPPMRLSQRLGQSILHGTVLGGSNVLVQAGVHYGYVSDKTASVLSTVTFGVAIYALNFSRRYNEHWEVAEDTENVAYIAATEAALDSAQILAAQLISTGCKKVGSYLASKNHTWSAHFFKTTGQLVRASQYLLPLAGACQARDWESSVRHLGEAGAQMSVGIGAQVVTENIGRKFLSF